MRGGGGKTKQNKQTKKRYKSNFSDGYHPTCQLINPSKPEGYTVSKCVLDEISAIKSTGGKRFVMVQQLHLYALPNVAFIPPLMRNGFPMH